MKREKLIVVRGGGDLATGTIPPAQQSSWHNSGIIHNQGIPRLQIFLQIIKMFMLNGFLHWV